MLGRELQAPLYQGFVDVLLPHRGDYGGQQSECQQHQGPQQRSAETVPI